MDIPSAKVAARLSGQRVEALSEGTDIDVELGETGDVVEAKVRPEGPRSTKRAGVRSAESAQASPVAGDLASRHGRFMHKYRLTFFLFFVPFMATTGIDRLGRNGWAPIFGALEIALAVAVSVGAGKEMWDARRKRSVDE